MPETEQAAIFIPMLVAIGLTFIAFFRLAFARAKVAKQMPSDFYRAQTGDPEPETARAAVRHYNNMLELPTVFYVACLTAYVLGIVTQWTVTFAWAFVVLRVVQSVIHMTYNNPMHRGMAFSLSALALIAMWVNVALGILAMGRSCL